MDEDENRIFCKLLKHLFRKNRKAESLLLKEHNSQILPSLQESKDK